MIIESIYYFIDILLFFTFFYSLFKKLVAPYDFYYSLYQSLGKKYAFYMFICAVLSESIIIILIIFSINMAKSAFSIFILSLFTLYIIFYSKTKESCKCFGNHSFLNNYPILRNISLIILCGFQLSLNYFEEVNGKLSYTWFLIVAILVVSYEVTIYIKEARSICTKNY